MIFFFFHLLNLQLFLKNVRLKIIVYCFVLNLFKKKLLKLKTNQKPSETKKSKESSFLKTITNLFTVQKTT